MNTLEKVSGILCLVSLASCSQGKEAESQASGQSTASASAEIVNCGEIEAVSALGTTPAPQTALGYVRVMPELETPKFKPGCPNIEAALGTRFGVQVLAKGPGLIVPLVTRVTHPEIRDPETGKAATVDQWESPMDAGITRYAGWSFDKPWELVPGRWRFEILDNDNKVLAAQDFVVTVKK